MPHIFKKSDFIISHSTGGYPPIPSVIIDYYNGSKTPPPDFEGRLSISNNNYNRIFDATALYKYYPLIIRQFPFESYVVNISIS